MGRRGSFKEQWEDRIGNNDHRFKVRVYPVPVGTWKLRPRNYEFDPCLVYWAMCPMPDSRCKDGISFRTIWLAFRESPLLDPEREFYDGEALVCNFEEVLRDVLVPSFRFAGTVNGRAPVVEIELLE